MINSTLINRLAVDASIDRFQKYRKEKYQSFLIAGKEYPGILHDTSMRKIQSVQISHQIEYLHLAAIDFAGKSVLDVGCNIGAFLQYAHMRGASRLTGFDLSISCLVEAAQLACLRSMREGVQIPLTLYQAEAADVVKYKSARSEVALLLAVLHHTMEPMRALQAVAMSCTSTLILEVQLYDPNLPCKKLDDMNVVLDSRVNGSKYGHGYYPTIDALHYALEKLNFRHIDVKGKGKLDSRVIVHARV
jgi:SAM-dependent methyltransferase